MDLFAPEIVQQATPNCVKFFPLVDEMNLVMTLYLVLLFVALTPGVLLYLPPNGTLLVAAIVHGIVFALVYYLTHKMVWRLSMEGFSSSPRLTLNKYPIPPKHLPPPSMF